MILEDVFAETDRFVEPASSKENSYYFVAAHTINGARFYSEPFDHALDATKSFITYEDVVAYFGGGTIELFRIDPDDFDVIAISRV